MDIREGGKRLVATISWVMTILVWISGAVISMRYAPRAKVIDDALLFGWVITFFVGIVIKVICHNVGLWILKGFVGDQNNNE